LYFLVDKDNKYSNFKNLFVDLSSIYAIKARISQKGIFQDAMISKQRKNRKEEGKSKEGKRRKEKIKEKGKNKKRKKKKQKISQFSLSLFLF